MPPEAPLLVKTWVGPEITPIDADGPRWPRHFRDPATNATLRNRTDADVRRAATDLATYALAAYLCLATAGSYFSYGWWYDVSQGPLWRVDQLDVAVGEPLGPPEFAGLACRRDYEGATVSVDLARWDSAAIVPKGT